MTSAAAARDGRTPLTPTDGTRERAHPADRGGAASGPASRALRVLVVDDVADAADALAEVAELLGCEARACYGGEAALAAFGSLRPDVVLLDLTMPGLDGLEVAARLRARAGPRPLLIAATTALGEVEARIATALAGFHMHLVKPVALPTLRAALDRFRAVIGPAAHSPGG